MSTNPPEHHMHRFPWPNQSYSNKDKLGLAVLLEVLMSAEKNHPFVHTTVFYSMVHTYLGFVLHQVKYLGIYGMLHSQGQAPGFTLKH